MPIYETANDRLRQTNALDRFVRLNPGLWEKWVPSGPLQKYDALIYDSIGRVNAIVEVKYRNNAKDKYPTYQIDKTKIDFLMNVPCQAFLLVSWDGDLHYLNLEKFPKKNPFPTTIAKRKDRAGEEPDVQYLIPTEEFVRIL